MPALTRKHSKHRADCWQVYFGDVQVGTIARRAGVPVDVDQWGWQCGFYPGSEPDEYLDGTAATFEQARDDFEGAWRVFSAKRAPADYQAWRDQRDWTTRKYAMWEAGEKLPTQKPNSTMRCPCGETFDSHQLEHSLIHVPHITKHRRETHHRSPIR
ncbi:hypothetical protein [Bradyrhizobium sp. Ash2021]|uniref:hypothetical protein n=1 Tax=Bradyrhizobium sp. Ash2021 TaxID=2954771 RepID=UPI0028160AEB|nr:hypothetical protein [Bradyrhizobium sp. Ash2021]WMT79395.1 hypothetical protein NL528_45815 [Bradyrhizobium sp. Ash2021]